MGKGLLSLAIVLAALTVILIVAYVVVMRDKKDS